jgi:hypothetical protein
MSNPPLSRNPALAHPPRFQSRQDPKLKGFPTPNHTPQPGNCQPENPKRNHVLRGRPGAPTIHLKTSIPALHTSSNPS